MSAQKLQPEELNVLQTIEARVTKLHARLGARITQTELGEQVTELPYLTDSLLKEINALNALARVIRDPRLKEEYLK